MLATINLPDGIIVNIREARKKFEEAIKNKGELNHGVDEILHTIVNCCRDRNCDEFQLHEFASEVDYCEQDNYVNGKHSQAILQFGLEVMTQIRSLNLYDTKHEVLPYEFEALGITGFNDLFLRKIVD